MDQSFLQDVLSSNMISLSPGSKSKDVNSKAINVADSSYSETNIFAFNARADTLSCQNSESIFEKTDGTPIISKLTSANNSVTSKKSNESPACFDINIEKILILSESMPATNGNNPSYIWPIELSYQPDFTEIVDADEEMNAYWDTIQQFFLNVLFKYDF